MSDGYLRGSISRPATQRQMDVLAAYVAAGGSVIDAAELVGIRPSTAKRHLADLRAKSGLTTEQPDLRRTSCRVARRPESGAVSACSVGPARRRDGAPDPPRAA